MKWISIFIIILLCVPISVSAEQWKKTDQMLFGSFLVLEYIDYRQTHSLVADDDFYETNLILGKDPSKSEIDIYFAGCVMGTYLIADKFPKRRRAWLILINLVQMIYVNRNIQMGITF